jgi:indolepyruvate ferredoxin oxidoreductase
VQSNCVSIVPIETEFGRKRAIDQSSCNKDYSCLKGFCPSFVTVEGRHAAQAAQGRSPGFRVDARADAAERGRAVQHPRDGRRRHGVVTIGALLGMAAHLESKGCSVLDMTGLAQKNGAVVSHVRIGDTPEKLYATRIAAVKHR